MLHRLILAAALAVGLSSAAQAQQQWPGVTVYDNKGVPLGTAANPLNVTGGSGGGGGSGGTVTQGPAATDTTANRWPVLAYQGGAWNVGLTGTLPAFAATPTFNLGTLNGAATAANQNVTAAGTSATNAQAVQGVAGGVPQNITQPDVRSSGTLDMSSTANVLTIPVPQGATTLSLNLIGVSGSGAGLVVNGTSNGTNYGVLGIYTRVGGGAPTSVINDQTGLVVSVAGLQAVQVAVSTAGTGTATISYIVSSAPYTPNVMNVSAGRGGLTNAWRINVSQATTHATLVKASPGRVHKITGYNATNSLRWLHFYNTTTTPVPGTTPVFFAVPLPPGVYSYDAMDIGYYFPAGIAYSITTGGADSDATAGAAGDILNQNIWYQ